MRSAIIFAIATFVFSAMLPNALAWKLELFRITTHLRTVEDNNYGWCHGFESVKFNATSARFNPSKTAGNRPLGFALYSDNACKDMVYATPYRRFAYDGPTWKIFGSKNVSSVYVGIEEELFGPPEPL